MFLIWYCFCKASLEWFGFLRFPQLKRRKIMTMDYLVAKILQLF